MKAPSIALFFASIVAVAGTASQTLAIDEAHIETGERVIERAIAYLRTQQDQTTGGWAISTEGPQLPAITGLIINGMLLDPAIDEHDPGVAKGIDYILKFRQPDGGVYDKVLANYNTAICLSALAQVNTPAVAAFIAPAQNFLRGLQWSEESIDNYETGKAKPDHPFYGGVGYDADEKRPDLSNLSMNLEALHDSGVSSNDKAFKRALVFLQRLQMNDAVNDMKYADGTTEGGFIYATSSSRDELGTGESKVGLVQTTLADGTKGSRLGTYGSMTYAGFKSYIYANLDRTDPRVTMAYDWIRTHYTLQENPGLGTDGMYYYFVMFSRALDAWGLETIDTLNPDGTPGATHDWANDLVERLASLQNEDGSFKVIDNRWMEDNQILITAYALLALQHAVR